MFAITWQYETDQELAMPLTPKMRRFAMEVAGGKCLSDAYRASYDAANMSAAVIRNESCKLMQRPDVTVMVGRLRGQQEASFRAATLGDREAVLTKLREMMESAQPSDMAKIRATELLGKSIGLFKEVKVQEPRPRSPDELRAELESRLAQYLGQVEGKTH